MARTAYAPAAPALAAAARAVAAVLGGESADAALEAAPGAGRPAIQAIALGTIRWYLRVAPAVEALLERPGTVPRPARALLACAAHQIEYSRHAPELTVNAAVDAARLLDQGRVAALVNAVLRRFVREREALLARVDASLPGRTAHPAWLVERLAAAWPGHYLAVLEANNAHPPLTLRVDPSRTTVAGYLEQLRVAGIDAYAVQWCPTAITLDHPRSIEELPGFAAGEVSVQDAGAQLVTRLLDLAPGQRVLDACAAPGGKTGAILEATGGEALVTAADVSPERVLLIEENLRRLKRAAHTVVADLTRPPPQLSEAPYDRILVDAPCSSSGVIRRHPDIKLLRRAADVGAFARTQLKLLRSAAGLLRPGGRLVYATCSVLPQENEAVVAALLEETPALRPVAAPAAATLVPGAIERAAGLQLLPGAEAGTDGFYYACLEKTTAGT